MKIVYIASIVIFFISCKCKKTSAEKKVQPLAAQKILVPSLQTNIDSAAVQGSILIYDLNNNTYYSNDFEWAKKGYLPASTFKIPNSIIALETAVVKNDSTLFKWDGEKRMLELWEQDLLFREAFHFSCVPCYQEVARKVGVENMTAYLKKMGYGEMQVDTSNIDLFWLEGASRISQFQQIDFLKRLYNSELPISKRTEGIMKRMMLLEEHQEYTLSGKTGWSIRNGNNNGWFVGYIQTKNNSYLFATNIEPRAQFNMNMFPMIRKEVTYKAFKQLNIDGWAQTN